MHHSSTSLYDRNASIIADEVDEFLTTTRYAEVNISHCIEHLGSSLVCCWQQIDDVGVDAFLGEHILYQCHDSPI